MNNPKRIRNIALVSVFGMLAFNGAFVFWAMSNNAPLKYALIFVPMFGVMYLLNKKIDKELAKAKKEGKVK